MVRRRRRFIVDRRENLARAETSGRVWSGHDLQTEQGPVRRGESRETERSIGAKGVKDGG